VSRLEDRRLLVGQGRFVDDVTRPGQRWLRVVRSPIAHGRIREIDVADALCAEGVTAVWTAKDLPEDLRIPVRIVIGGLALEEYLQPVLASEFVRYVGEPVAVVIASDPYLCEDAADRVRLDFEELPAVLHVGANSSGEGRTACTLEAGFGDVEAAFSAAHHVTEITVSIGRHSAVPLECRGLVAEWDEALAHLDIWGATKVPVFLKRTLASLLDLDAHQIHCWPSDAGGGFGVRGEVYPEDVLVSFAAKKLGGAVKWVEDRAEHLVAANHSRDQTHQLSAAFDEDGTIRGLKASVLHDNGAYIRTHGVVVPELTISMLPGPYRIPAYAARIEVGLTNKTPCGTYRSPGRFEGTFSREHLLDVAASELGIDRIELRRRNLLTLSDMPHQRDLSALGTPMILADADYRATLEAAVAAMSDWPKQRDELIAQGRKAGLGIACFVEKSGFGPFETGEVRIETTGAVRAFAGATSLGQGAETVVAKVVGDVLCTSPHSVEVELGDTDNVPWGGGSFASRSTVVGGSAIHLAATAVKETALAVGAEMLGVDSGVRLVEGRVESLDEPTRSVTFAEIARACEPGGPYASPEAPGLRAVRVFSVDRMTYPDGVHAVLVSIDPETGQVRLERYLVVYEVGRAISMAMLEGQLVGGVAQAIGGALYEQFAYDDNGQPISTTFADYLLPTAEEVPAVETIIRECFPARTNPLGVKGGGEGGLTAGGGAIANAVRDALGLTGAVPQLPLTPELVLTLLRSTTHDGPSAPEH
jgi:carbon-monoxide dehydrogenase large subunit